MNEQVPSKEWMRRWTDLQLAQESTQSVAASALVCELVAEVEQLNRQLDEANESIIQQAFLPPLKVTTLLDENSRLLAELRAAVEQTEAIRELWTKAVIVQDGNKGTVSFETAQEADTAFDYLMLLGSIGAPDPEPVRVQTGQPHVYGVVNVGHPGCPCKGHPTNCYRHPHDCGCNVSESAELLANAERIVADYARRNPKWADVNGVIQDPCGTHAWLERYRATKPPGVDPCG